MRAKHFARIWEFDNEGEKTQLLVFAEPEGDDGTTVIHQIVNFEGAQMDAAIRGKINIDTACKRIMEMPDEMAEKAFRWCVNATKDIPSGHRQASRETQTDNEKQ